MWLYILAIILLVIICVVLSLYIVNNNKFKEINTKIDTAENEMNLLLENEMNSIEIIAKLIEEKNESNKIEELENFDRNSLDSFDLFIKTNHFFNKINEIIEYEKEIIFDDEEKVKLSDLKNINIKRNATKKYYNDNVIKYNELINKFPTSLISKIRRYEEKKFYSEKKEEMFEILKK